MKSILKVIGALFGLPSPSKKPAQKRNVMAELDKLAVGMVGRLSPGKPAIKRRASETTGAIVAPQKKVRKPRRSREEIEAEREIKAKRLAEKSRQSAMETMERQLAIGITHYTWQTSGDERTCEDCAKNDGKRFAWAVPPRTGHPGDGKCCQNGHCRCVAIPVFDLDREEERLGL